MTPEEKFGHWKSYAEQDLDAAEAMFETGRWFYVLFCCQQAIEKLVKGLYVIYVDENVPRIHNIKAIVERIEDKLTVEIPETHYRLFKILTGYYTDSRYPDYINKVGKGVDKVKSSEILKNTREAFVWLLTLRPSED